MSDLISRSALIKAIRKHMVDNMCLYEDEKTVVEIIEEQPVAYDVDKVVEEIHEAYSCKDCEDKNSNEDYFNVCTTCCEKEVTDDICRIVRKGGVNE